MSKLKKNLKKYVSLVLVAIIAMTGLLFTPTEKVEAAEVCSDSPGHAVWEVCAENDGANVIGKIFVLPWVNYFYTMQLQRYENGKWRPIGTRTGKLTSADIDWHVFSNIKRNNGRDKLKIYVKIFRDEKHLDYIGAVQSPYIYR